MRILTCTFAALITFLSLSLFAPISHGWVAYNLTDKKIRLRAVDVESTDHVSFNCFTNRYGLVLYPPEGGENSSSTRGAGDVEWGYQSPKPGNTTCNPGGSGSTKFRMQVLIENDEIARWSFIEQYGLMYCEVDMEFSGWLEVKQFTRKYDPEVGSSVTIADGYTCISFTSDGAVLDTSDYFNTRPDRDTTNRDIKFLVTGDPQYYAHRKDDESTYDQGVIDTSDAVLKAMRDKLDLSTSMRGAIVSGDLTQHAAPNELDFYRDALGKHEHKFFEGLGNHDVERETDNRDIPNENNTAALEYYIAWKARSTRLTSRTLDGVYTNPNYSWDWHDVHFVQLNVFAGNSERFFDSNADDCSDSGECGSPIDPHNSLDFLKQTLSRNVGSTGRPVVLIQHYGFDDFAKNSWKEKDRKNLWNAIKNYNVVAFFTGHTHLGSSDDFFDEPFEKPDGADSRKDGRIAIPAFDASAALNGLYLEVQMDRCNRMSITRYDSQGTSHKTADVRFETANNVWNWIPTECDQGPPSGKFEPNAVTGVATASDAIELSWDDLRNDDDEEMLDTLPTGYIVECAWDRYSFETFSDGIRNNVDQDCADGYAAQFVDYNVGKAVFSGLERNTEYWFKVTPFADSQEGTIQYHSQGADLKVIKTPDAGLKLRLNNRPDSANTLDVLVKRQSNGAVIGGRVVSEGGASHITGVNNFIPGVDYLVESTYIKSDNTDPHTLSLSCTSTGNSVVQQQSATRYTVRFGDPRKDLITCTTTATTSITGGFQITLDNKPDSANTLRYLVTRDVTGGVIGGKTINEEQLGRIGGPNNFTRTIDYFAALTYNNDDNAIAYDLDVDCDTNGSASASWDPVEGKITLQFDDVATETIDCNVTATSTQDTGLLLNLVNDPASTNTMDVRVVRSTDDFEIGSRLGIVEGEQRRISGTGNFIPGVVYYLHFTYSDGGTPHWQELDCTTTGNATANVVNSKLAEITFSKPAEETISCTKTARVYPVLNLSTAQPLIDGYDSTSLAYSLEIFPGLWLPYQDISLNMFDTPLQIFVFPDAVFRLLIEEPSDSEFEKNLSCDRNFTALANGYAVFDGMPTGDVINCSGQLTGALFAEFSIQYSPYPEEAAPALTLRADSLQPFEPIHLDIDPDTESLARESISTLAIDQVHDLILESQLGSYYVSGISCLNSSTGETQDLDVTQPSIHLTGGDKVTCTWYLDIDTDGDGVTDRVDNCPLIANPDQEPAEEGSRGAACVDSPPGC